VNLSKLVEIIDKAYNNDGAFMAAHDGLDGDGLATFLYNELMDALVSEKRISNTTLEEYLRMLIVAEEEIHRVRLAIERLTLKGA
jgi:hypothetical protein